MSAPVSSSTHRIRDIYSTHLAMVPQSNSTPIEHRLKRFRDTVRVHKKSSTDNRKTSDAISINPKMPKEGPQNVFFAFTYLYPWNRLTCLPSTASTPAKKQDMRTSCERPSARPGGDVSDVVSQLLEHADKHQASRPYSCIPRRCLRRYGRWRR